MLLSSASASQGDSELVVLCFCSANCYVLLVRGIWKLEPCDFTL